MTRPPYTRVIPVPWGVTVLGFLPSPSFRRPSWGQEALGLLWQSSLDGWQMWSPGAGLAPACPLPGRLPTLLACSTDRGVDIGHGGIFFFTEPELDEPHRKPWKRETQATVTPGPGEVAGPVGAPSSGDPAAAAQCPWPGDPPPACGPRGHPGAPPSGAQARRPVVPAGAAGVKGFPATRQRLSEKAGWQVQAGWQSLSGDTWQWPRL